MTADFHKNFDKQFKRLSSAQQQQVKDVIIRFLTVTPSPLTLRDHALKGDWMGHRSISAGGDLRLHYKVVHHSTVLFVAVGTHSQLYK